MEESPIAYLPRPKGHGLGNAPRTAPRVYFNKDEFKQILDVYGRMVASGRWRDYAINDDSHEAAFCVFRHASEGPLYRIVKRPKLARKQGLYSVISASGQILRRGHTLANILKVFNSRKFKLVVSN